ncbi:MarR family EPS-associated transcriptional regulator [Candidatus Pelagibacter sp. Uisw_099_02]|uniref:MarR family EPS-associated transcriptional regulator n=1 Tax=Candidatus Pelagibacter sp. Uisw_099_02 TaxID=3230981 RepID=UPI0039E87CB7|tara:strand:- start:135 stop:422 length:288 start_codon:yes stop_codon:yes gene_type:complete
MNNDELSILRKIEKEKQINQRKIASELGISLGKVNYCLKELKKRGFIKINNFSQSKKKLNYIYLVTPKGITAKTKAVLNFMKIKMREYEELKKDL